MMKPENYNVGLDENGKRFRVVIEWYNEKGEFFIKQSKDIEEAETILGLLSGNISFADLEP